MKEAARGRPFPSSCCQRVGPANRVDEAQDHVPQGASSNEYGALMQLSLLNLIEIFAIPVKLQFCRAACRRHLSGVCVPRVCWKSQ